MVEKDVQYVGSNNEIPNKHEHLLNTGEREISRAMESSNYPSEYLSVKSKIESLKGKHGAAKASISEAIRELSRSRTRYTDLKAEFGRTENRIETRRQQSELEYRADEIADSINSIEKKISNSERKISSLESDLDSIQQEFQRTFLEYIGFFSAVIAAIVITGQMALEVANPREVGQLIIVSYGGLLFAFGGFATILSSDKSEYLTRIALSIAGLLTAVLALYII